MAGVPRTTVEDAFISGLSCAVCGQSDIYVQHLPSYPDFVTCRACGAAFVVEDTGERVMYAKVPDGYPDTSEFALRQWVWVEAGERRGAAAAVAPTPPDPAPCRPGSRGVPLASDTGPTDESLPAWLRESPAPAVSRAAEASRPAPAPAATPAPSIPAAVTVASAAAAPARAPGGAAPA